MLDKVVVFGQNSIKFNMDLKIYVDPFRLNDRSNDADIIFITHDHYDHFSLEDIEKVIKDDTVLVVPRCMENIVNNFKNVLLVDYGSHEVKGIEFDVIPAYNIDKKFHPKDKKYVGYILKLDDHRYYIAGDTDDTLEAEEIKCDVAFLPIGGTFTMNPEEACQLAKKINPQIVVPVHYGSIVGTSADGEHFKVLMDKTNIECVLMIK